VRERVRLGLDHGSGFHNRRVGLHGTHDDGCRVDDVDFDGRNVDHRGTDQEHPATTHRRR
jgi:hypothetical protein